MTDPTAADIAAMLERYPRDDFYTWVHRREPRRTVRELVRVARLDRDWRDACDGEWAGERCGTCSPCTARAWIAEQRGKDCVKPWTADDPHYPTQGKRMPCGTCVPCVLEEMSDA